MKVVVTDRAKESLLPIYAYHFAYSEAYADAFQDKLDTYLTTTLADNPKLGHLYHRDQGIYRLIYRQQYNVYYVIQAETVFVVYVFDGQMDINQRIERGAVDLPDLPDS